MNKQMWNLYKESDRGKKCIEMFNPEIENTYDGIKAILDFSEKWENKIPVNGWLDLNFLFEANLPSSGLLPEDGNWKCFCQKTNIAKKQHSFLLCRFSYSILTHFSNLFCCRHILM